MRVFIHAEKVFRSFAPALALLLFMTTVAMAKATSPAARMNQAIAAIDGDAAGSGQTQIVTDWLAREFSVSAQNVLALRRRLSGFGEVAAVYAFADKMPGGITDDNVNRVVSARHERKDWDAIASVHGLRLKSVSTEVQAVSEVVHKAITQASAGKAAKGAGAGGEG